MAFTNNFRIERVYFERLKTMIDVLKAFKDNVTDEPTRTILENSIDVDGATLLLYRNLGEAWAELADLIQKTRELLQSLDEKTEKYHDELNERIDEVNNYLMALIRALEARVDAIESDLAQMGRLFTYELTRVNDAYTLTESGNPVTFSDTAAKYAHNRAHLVTVRGNVDGETTYFFPREYDTSTESGLFEWYAFGFVGIEIHEITVTLLPDNSVNVSIERTDFADIRSKIASLTLVTNDLISRMTNAETDIDTLEATAENLEANKQDKLIAGSGISIDEETGEIKNTAQGATYSAGSGISITNNVISTDDVSSMGAQRHRANAADIEIEDFGNLHRIKDEYITSPSNVYKAKAVRMYVEFLKSVIYNTPTFPESEIGKAFRIDILLDASQTRFNEMLNIPLYAYVRSATTIEFFKTSNVISDMPSLLVRNLHDTLAGSGLSSSSKLIFWWIYNDIENPIPWSELSEKTKDFLRTISFYVSSYTG